MSEGIVIALITTTGSLIGGIIGAIITAYATIKAAGLKVEQTPSQAFAQAQKQKVHWLWGIIGGAVIGAIITLGVLVLTGIVPELPISSVSLKSPLQDDFDNSAFDGNYNDMLWSCNNNCFSQPVQQNGYLYLEVLKPTKEGDGIYVHSKQEWTINEINSLRGQLRLHNGTAGGGVFLNVTEAECSIRIQSPSIKPVFACDYTELDGEFVRFTEEITVNFDTWYAVRIDIDDKTKKISCYLDDKIVGEYTPISLRNKSVVWMGVWSENKGDIVASLDDVGLFVQP